VNETQAYWEAEYAYGIERLRRAGDCDLVKVIASDLIAAFGNDTELTLSMGKALVRHGREWPPVERRARRTPLLYRGVVGRRMMRVRSRAAPEQWAARAAIANRRRARRSQRLASSSSTRRLASYPPTSALAVATAS